PGPAIVVARRGERSSRKQFGIKPVRRALRRIAPHRERSRNRLAGEVIAKARLIARGAAAALPSHVSPRPLLRGSVHTTPRVFRTQIAFRISDLNVSDFHSRSAGRARTPGLADRADELDRNRN